MNPQKNYRYRLSRSSKKHICPNCQQKSFTYYEDTETGEELPESGRCDRQDKCGHHQSPTRNKVPRAKLHLIQSKPAPVVLIPDAELEALRTPESIRESQFFKNMVNHGFTESLVLAVFNLYKIGTLDGCTAFPYIDRNRGIRAVSLIEYGADNHRVKGSFKSKWLHSWVKKHASPLPGWVNPYSAQEKKATALFGEHLLDQYPNNPLNVVEAPKTAIVAAMYYGLPKSANDEKTQIWVAVGARDWLNDETVSMLAKERERRHRVKLWPDLSEGGVTFKEWQKKSRGLLFVSGYLEKIATDKDRKDGKDLADFLLECPLPSFTLF